jgi:hypothetical protein
MTTTTDTPKDACPHCGAEVDAAFPSMGEDQFKCGSWSRCAENDRTSLCRRLEAEAEVERLKGRMKRAEDLVLGLHEGWKKARKAHLETCKNAQREIDKLHTENVCLQELIQEFYEWSRRDFPTEQEVREIMNRYYDLLNK